MRLKTFLGALTGLLLWSTLAMAGQQGPNIAALKRPANFKEQAPAVYKVQVVTSKGPFVIQVTRAWAPRGADRFYNLVKAGYYDDNRFFRVLDDFMAQVGMHGDPSVYNAWQFSAIEDDPRGQSNRRGTVTFASKGRPGTRTVQIFINTAENGMKLDRLGFVPFGEVISGMPVVDQLYSGYGEGAPDGRGPDQMQIEKGGNRYLNALFPKLDFIKTARITK